MVRGYLAAILLWSLLACGIVLAAGFDLLSPCSPSLPYYVDVGRYNIPEDLDVDLRIRSGVVTNERNRYRAVMEYASKLGSDLANQTIIMETRALMLDLNKDGKGDCHARDPCKFTDVVRFTKIDMKRIFDNQLDRGPALNILNIGGGTGLLSFLLWKAFGHHVDTCDIPSVAFQYDGHYPVMASFFGITKRHWFITNVTTASPPSWLGTYDVVLIYWSVFNKFWDPQGHKDFLMALLPHIAPGGLVHWESNNFPGATEYHSVTFRYPELIAIANESGRTIPFQRYKHEENNT